MTTDTIQALRLILFWLQRMLPEYQELWLHLLNYLANYG